MHTRIAGSIFTFISSFFIFWLCDKVYEGVVNRVIPYFAESGEEEAWIVHVIDYLSPIGVVIILVPASLCIGFAVLSPPKVCYGSTILFSIGIVFTLFLTSIGCIVIPLGVDLSGPRDISTIRWIVNVVYVLLSLYLIILSFIKFRGVKSTSANNAQQTIPDTPPEK